MEGGRWRLVEGMASDAMGLEGLGVLGAPSSSEAGLCVVASAGEPAVGWGSLTDRPVIAPERLLPVLHGGCPACALLQPAGAISRALDLVGDLPDVGVVDGSLLGELVGRILSARSIRVRSDDPVDLVVDASGDVDGWQQAMARLRPEGTFLALLPPDLRPARFDFYPQVHRRSLRLLARHWHDPVEEAPLEELHAVTSVLAESLARLEVDGASLPGSAWWWFEWPRS